MHGGLSLYKTAQVKGKIMSNEYVSNGIGIGSVLAAIISWTTWKSFWWALLHGILGWFYIIYWAIKY